MSKVFIAVMDRHPRGAGGKAALEASGISTEAGFLEDEAAAIYEEFFSSLD